MGKISSFFKSPWWNSISAIIAIFVFFGTRAQQIMNLNWVTEAAKWSLWVGMFIFAVHAYYFSRSAYEKLHVKINNLTNFSLNLQTLTYNIEGSLNRSIAYTFNNTPSVAYIWWLRAAQSYNVIKNNEMIRMALGESLENLKKVNSSMPTEIEEMHNILSDIKDNSFKIEKNLITSEIKRLTSKTT